MPLKVLFATAELAPVARVGGLAAAAAGLVGELRSLGVAVEVALADYGGIDLEDERSIPLAVPEWAGPAAARRGNVPGLGDLTLVSARGLERPHPYTRSDGAGWPDNDYRFMAFSAAIGALVAEREPDIVHLNDWHTAAALAFVPVPPPAVLTIHTLGYQGRTNPGWLGALPYHRLAFLHQGDANPLAGGIRLADLVVAVSPAYAEEITTPAGGAGLDGVLRDEGAKLVGILNGIDTQIWDPSTDPELTMAYDASDPSPKARNRAAVRRELALPDRDTLLAIMVTRLVGQKGVDLVVPAAKYLEGLGLQLAVLGDGDDGLADDLLAASTAFPGHVAFRRGYDEGLAHRLFAGGDLLVMPSRFEPCGLAQMQAMRYGTLPVVTPVGGLLDTVHDAEADPTRGNGIVARDVSDLGVLDALHRAARLAADAKAFVTAQQAGMTADWSWREPAETHVSHYERLIREVGR